ncbi:MAG: 50S ribosomal protein L25 [bacterium]|nr:50S ribosomal protein L25 [bacterium]
MQTLQAEKRDIFGKQLKRPRALGKMPVVAYGPGKDNYNLFVVEKEFVKLYREVGESSMIGVETEGGRLEAIIQDVTMHPVTGKPLHADLYLIERGKKIQVTVPFEFVGTAPAVKTFGGILVKVMHEVDVEVLPSQIPQVLEIDVSPLVALGDSITIGDITVPEGVEILAETSEVIASIDTQNEEEDIDTGGDIDFSAIESEKKGKKEEEESSE